VLLGPHRNELRSAAPRCSPGLVKSDELVLRTILDPDHIEPSGHLKPVAIPLADLQYRGWSVDRRRFTSLRQIRLFHQQWKSRNPSIDRFHVMQIRVREIRLNPETANQEFVVIDTASCGKPCHASVLLPTPQNKSAARQLRDELLKRMPPYVETRNAFESQHKWGFLLGLLLQSLVFLASLRLARTWKCLFFVRR
jgi:hypothetical protein